MSRAKILQPDLVLGDIVIHLTPSLIQKYNLKGLVLDVDETLVPWKEKQLSPELIEWVTEVKQVTDLWLVSNNLSQSRISNIASSLDLPFIFGAAKPSRRKLRQAVTAMNHPLEQVAMVGDRLFTDVLAGNRLGMFTILVEPMVETGGKKKFSLRNFEVWLSQKLGVSLYKS
ncbi:MAG: YqeG family HAD IIIA-type phosphatase [Cyanobacteria bacterium]|nr:YqeG family HAD IIIA-type phosphatase [Cyanobacteria bacterium CG_2015-16_32_12]NCO78283.1 YqeG family HAD IIIA-type phosphatase [Cyanobacteria bacterium CG_2015-22_32_23]NCQ02920.1 YqeG family HAD IIIA-type phosphatase [Cyanobacteria bacterium CG_2015-09_32_10]NCQ41195.1 YqeG family HAD IIIA-type phosphatase [Cyanobacteria bacterium CG_2015-04_32_10]NCS83509.1 YqeG family HAD IIIA-type phosphatase [Cyanobacteria bacterium CG_2015-02_32_10]